MDAAFGELHDIIHGVWAARACGWSEREGGGLIHLGGERLVRRALGLRHVGQRFLPRVVDEPMETVAPAPLFGHWEPRKILASQFGSPSGCRCAQVPRQRHLLAIGAPFHRPLHITSVILVAGQQLGTGRFYPLEFSGHRHQLQ